MERPLALPPGTPGYGEGRAVFGSPSASGTAALCYLAFGARGELGVEFFCSPPQA